MDMMVTVAKCVVAICAGFTAVCVAGGWVIKIILAVKKPKEDIDAKLQRDYDRLNDMDQVLKEFEEQFSILNEKLDSIEEFSKFLLENDMIAFEHMRTNNATGKISKREHDIDEFLLDKKDV